MGKSISHGHIICKGNIQRGIVGLMKTLIDYMRREHLKQTQMAAVLGIGQGQLNHWLNKRRVPTVNSLKLIAQKTGLPLEKLIKDL